MAVIREFNWNLAVLVMVVLFSAIDDSAAQQPGDSRLILAAKVRAVFEAKCVQCHGDDVAKPDADFGFIRDLRRVANHSAYIVKGSPQDSELFRMMRDGEMPPDDSGLKPATAEEKQIIRAWITADAPHRIPDDWKEIAAKSKIPPPKDNPPTPPTYSSRLPDSIAQTPVTIEMLDKSAAEILRKIAEEAKIDIDYQPPANDPKLSIRLKSGTLAEAVGYIALNADLVLKWENAKLRLETKTTDKPKKSDVKTSPNP